MATSNEAHEDALQHVVLTCDHPLDLDECLFELSAVVNRLSGRGILSR